MLPDTADWEKVKEEKEKKRLLRAAEQRSWRCSGAKSGDVEQSQPGISHVCVSMHNRGRWEDSWEEVSSVPTGGQLSPGKDRSHTGR